MRNVRIDLVARAGNHGLIIGTPNRGAKNGKDRITDAEGKGDSVFLSVVFAAIATKTWNGFALASRLLDGAAELHRLMRNFTTAGANGDGSHDGSENENVLH